MTEDQNVPPPPPPPPPPVSPGGAAPQPPQPETDPEQQEESLREELSKARKRNKWLIGLSAVLGTLFIIIGGAVYVIYSRISDAKDSFEEMMSSMPAPAPASPGFGRGGAAYPGRGVYSSTSPAGSSLGLFAPGGLGRGGGAAPASFDPQQAEKVLNAMSKYADRPIVKEFLADLKQDPDMAAAFDAKDKKNPLAMIAHAQKSKGVERIMLKYATRPEFMMLMMEVMADPEMQPFMKGMSGMMPGGMSPDQGTARPVQMQQMPNPMRAPDRPGDEDGDGELSMDPNAMRVPQGHRTGGGPIDDIDTE